MEPTAAVAVERNPTRRDFLVASALTAGTVLTGCATPGPRHGPGILVEPQPDRIRVGVIGCGGRGTGAAIDCVRAAPNVHIVALGDLFRERVDSCRTKLREAIGSACDVPDENCFDGFDNYRGILACATDLVILAAPPGFRPPHLAAAIAAGKHVFMEKPVAVDPVGVRSIIASAELARQKRLAIVAGTQRRHQVHYLEAMKRVHDGQIGDIVAAQCYWNQGELWVVQRDPAQSDMEWQCRNWLYFTWLSGDHIVEQHVHNLDAVNWALRAVPEKCLGMGGREVRTAPEYGNIFDHFSTEYEYPGGVRVMSACRQIKGCAERVAERIVGTRGVLRLDSSNAEITGRRPWKYQDPNPPNPYVLEHRDLLASIRAGRPLNEGRQVAESTLTAIMGRMSAYTGRELSWSWALNASKLDLTPPQYAFGDLPVAPIAVPGETALV